MLLRKQVCHISSRIASAPLIQRQGKNLGQCGVYKAFILSENSHARERVDGSKVLRI